MNADEIWSKALLDLQNRVTKAAFDTWLADTKGHLQGDVFTVLAHSWFARQLLEERYMDLIEPAVCRAAGRALGVRVEYKKAAGTLEAEAVVRLVSFDPSQRGWVATSNYAVRFWQPLMGGQAFQLWITLRSFAYGAGNSGLWPSIRLLALICFGGDRSRVRGRRRARKDGSEYWRAGALEVLEGHKIVWWSRCEARSVTGHQYLRYFFSVLDSLPLLTAEQVRRLHPQLQRSHQEFVRAAGLDFEQWSQLEFPSMLEPRALQAKSMCDV